MSYFAWALSQASLLLAVKDAKGNQLCLGDQVSFRLGAHGHIGTVEGRDPHHKQAVVVHSPAFVNSNISLLTHSVQKITKEEAKEIINDYTEKTNDGNWHVECLLQEITTLRAKKDTWTKKEYAAAIFYEHQLENIKKRVKHDVLISSI
jgi:hypothetical protein